MFNFDQSNSTIQKSLQIICLLTKWRNFKTLIPEQQVCIFPDGSFVESFPQQTLSHAMQRWNQTNLGEMFQLYRANNSIFRRRKCITSASWRQKVFDARTSMNLSSACKRNFHCCTDTKCVPFFHSRQLASSVHELNRKTLPPPCSAS